MKVVIVPELNIEFIADDREADEIRGEAELSIQNLLREIIFADDEGKIEITRKIMEIKKMANDIISNKNN